MNKHKLNAFKQYRDKVKNEAKSRSDVFTDWRDESKYDLRARDFLAGAEFGRRHFRKPF